MNDALVGYRKLISVLLAMAATYAIAKGMPPELANTLQGVGLEAIPSLLSIVYMWFNNQSKKITATTSQTPQATAQPPIITSSPPTPPAIPQLQPPPEALLQPPNRPPIVDTMPPFDASDDVLTLEQKQAIAVWYSKPISNPPTMPDIPKIEYTLYTDKLRQDQQRRQQAGEKLMSQCIDLFNPQDLDRVLKMRASCDHAIRNKVNYHWNLAGDRWYDYAIALWLFKEGMPLN
jgi:hypothetical protein